MENPDRWKGLFIHKIRMRNRAQSDCFEGILTAYSECLAENRKFLGHAAAAWGFTALASLGAEVGGESDVLLAEGPNGGGSLDVSGKRVSTTLSMGNAANSSERVPQQSPWSRMRGEIAHLYKARVEQTDEILRLRDALEECKKHLDEKVQQLETLKSTLLEIEAVLKLKEAERTELEAQLRLLASERLELKSQVARFQKELVDKTLESDRILDELLRRKENEASRLNELQAMYNQFLIDRENHSASQQRSAAVASASFAQTTQPIERQLPASMQSPRGVELPTGSGRFGSTSCSTSASPLQTAAMVSTPGTAASPYLSAAAAASSSGAAPSRASSTPNANVPRCNGPSSPVLARSSLSSSVSSYEPESPSGGRVVSGGPPVVVRSHSCFPSGQIGSNFSSAATLHRARIRSEGNAAATYFSAGQKSVAGSMADIGGSRPLWLSSDGDTSGTCAAAFPSSVTCTQKAHEGSVHALDVSLLRARFSSGLLVSGGQDGYLALLDPQTIGLHYSFPAAPNKSSVLALEISTDEKSCLAACSDQCLYVVDLDTQRGTSHLRGHSGRITACGYRSAASPYKAFSTSLDRTIRIWDINRAACVKTTYGLSPVTAAARSTDCEYIVTGHQNGSLNVWNLRSENCAHVNSVETFHDDIITGLTFSAEGTFVAAQTKDSVIKTFDFRRGSIMRSYQSPGFRTVSPQAAPCFSTDSAASLLVAASSMCMCCWDTSSGYLVASNPTSSPAICLNWTSPQFLTAHKDGTVLSWERGLQGSAIMSPAAGSSRVKFML